jgi:hypothetical protein
MNHVFQIYLSRNHTAPPPEVQRCIASIKQMSANHTYHFFDDRRAKNFLRDHYSAQVLEAYETLHPLAFKADLLRYCLLNKYGGWYFDITCTATRTIPSCTNNTTILFKDAPHPDAKPWNISNAAIFSPPCSKTLSLAISLILKRVRLREYPDDVLSLTGPSLLGRCAAITTANQTTFGMLLPLTPNHPRKNYAFVLPDGTIIAWAKETLGQPNSTGLSAYGAKGTDDYLRLFASKSIYRNEQ